MNERPAAGREGRGLWAGKTMAGPRPKPVARYSRVWFVYSIVLLVAALAWVAALAIIGGSVRDFIAPSAVGLMAALGAWTHWRLRRRNG